MSDLRGFHYALQPLLLTSRWKAEQLQRELWELDAEIKVASEARARLYARIADGERAWEELVGREQDAQTYMHCAHYLRSLGSKSAEADEGLAVLATRRGALVDALLAAQRALETVDAHRGEIQQQFVRDRLSKEYRLTDDLWSTQAASRELR